MLLCGRGCVCSLCGGGMAKPLALRDVALAAHGLRAGFGPSLGWVHVGITVPKLSEAHTLTSAVSTARPECWRTGAGRTQQSATGRPSCATHATTHLPTRSVARYPCGPTTSGRCCIRRPCPPRLQREVA